METQELLGKVIKARIKNLRWLAQHPALIENYKDNVSAGYLSIEIKYKV